MYFSALGQLRSKLSALTFIALFSGCAHVGTTPTPVAPAAPSDASAATAAVSAEAVLTDTSPPPADLTDSGADLKAVPLAVNRQVLKWIDYFQGQGRPHMERYLSRSTRYMPIMKKILKENGLPEDLIYIALIESGFSSTAHSSASAVGYWQFIRGTGKQYGMKIDTFVDERRDFVRSTQAAAAYFNGLYSIFHSWYLAIASYNVGENRVKSLVAKHKTRDFWLLARENKLPAETSDYVPKFIAARLIAKSPEKYGFTDIEYMPPLNFSEINFTTSIDLRKLAKEMGLEYDDLRDLNPSYKRGVAFDKNGKLMLRVPKGTEKKATAYAASAVPENKKLYVADEDFGYYRIRRGDTIASIARKFSTSQRNIRELNKLGSSTALVAGKRIRVPAETVAGITRRESSESKAPKEPAAKGPSSDTKSDVKKVSPSGAAPSIGVGAAQRYMTATRQPANIRQHARHSIANDRTPKKIYIVRKGDTLMDIARRYRVSLKELVQKNKINRRAKISVGTRLEIPQ